MAKKIIRFLISQQQLYADILIYSMLLVNNLELDVEEIVLRKLEQNKMNYSVEKAYGVKTKYTDL
ncbi:MazG-like family protein [Priestia megaterium]